MVRNGCERERLKLQKILSDFYLVSAIAGCVQSDSCMRFPLSTFGDVANLDTYTKGVQQR